MKPSAMKPLTISGFITAILLIALSIYVVEDLPAFGDENSPVNKYVKLFNVDADGLVESLNAGILPLQIKIKIEDMGILDPISASGKNVGASGSLVPSLSDEYIIQYVGKRQTKTNQED